MYFATEPKPGAAVRDGKIVIHRFRNVNGLDGIAECVGQLRNLEAGIGGITPTVIKEIADVMCLEYFDQTLVFTPVLLQDFLICNGRSQMRLMGYDAEP